MTYTVTVTNFSPTTKEQQLHDFFSFCGKISSIEIKDKQALIHFEKAASANTATLLNGGSLDGAHITVISDTDHPETPDERAHDDHPIEQSDKPRAGIAAEYLAKGYVLSDDILHRAIEFDKSQGISSRFLSYLHSFDSTIGSRIGGEGTTLSSAVNAKVQPIVSDVQSKVQPVVNDGVTRARTLDEQRGISKTANSYYSSALASPLGQRVLEFYTNTTKQVVDIHEEALRIAASQKTQQGGANTSLTGAPTTAEPAAAPLNVAPVPLA
ncbi:hypothetical protein BKA62DRAFT_696660 [Auriculariales sp. MPI-PUGE-AT-0066]|nr:hypothetical protein BKA62DRAFT_696660 [Auriculariales sp. MPI-PUGE-AT-0066]